MSYNTKNYTEQGGEKTVIGGEVEILGTLTIDDGATVAGVVTAAVVNNLTTTASGKALDARQGKALNDKITALTPVNALDSESTAAPLAAAQGKALKDLVDAKYTAANATEAAAGLVKQSAPVEEATGDAPTAAQFNALLDALKAAGIMAAE